MIGRSGERGSGISVLPAQHDDDDKATPTKNNILTQQDGLPFFLQGLNSLFINS